MHALLDSLKSLATPAATGGAAWAGAPLGVLITIVAVWALVYALPLGIARLRVAMGPRHAELAGLDDGPADTRPVSPPAPARGGTTMPRTRRNPGY